MLVRCKLHQNSCQFASGGRGRLVLGCGIRCCRKIWSNHIQAMMDHLVAGDRRVSKVTPHSTVPAVWRFNSSQPMSSGQPTRRGGQRSAGGGLEILRDRRGGWGGYGSVYSWDLSSVLTTVAGWAIIGRCGPSFSDVR